MVEKGYLICRLQDRTHDVFREGITWPLSHPVQQMGPKRSTWQIPSMRNLYLTFFQLTVINFCSVISSTVKKLTNKLPDLLSKIESINQQLLPLGNISDNVDRIRELIQQARDAANKVGVSPHCWALKLLLWEVSTLIKKGKAFVYTETGCLSFSNSLVVRNVKVDFLLSSFKSAFPSGPKWAGIQTPEAVPPALSLCRQEEGHLWEP